MGASPRCGGFWRNMSTGARIAWFLLKWVLAPAALALVGYFVVGPMIGRAPVAPAITEPTTEEATKVSEFLPPGGGPPKRRFEAPEVDVRVTRRESRTTREPEAAPRPRPERNRVERVEPEPAPEPAPEPEEPPIEPVPSEEPPPDEAGSGGAAGAEPPTEGSASPPDGGG